MAWVALSLARRERRNAAILIARWGFAGKAPKTLHQIGAANGLTRERIRQIEVRARKLMSRRCFQTPYLDRAPGIWQRVVLEPGSSVIARLNDGGNNENELRTGRNSRGRPLMAASHLASPWCESVRRHIWLARKRRQRRNGCYLQRERATAQPGRFASRSWQSLRRLFSEPKFLKMPLGSHSRSRPHTAWLDDERNWFWIRDAKRNRLRNQIWKVLSVCNGIRTAELRDAVRRWHRLRGSVPPRNALERFCAEIGGISVDGGRVVADAPPLPEVCPWGQ